MGRRRSSGVSSPDRHRTPPPVPPPPSSSSTHVGDTPSDPSLTPTTPERVRQIFRGLDDVLTAEASKFSKATGQKVRDAFASLNEIITTQLVEISTLKGRLEARPLMGRATYASVAAPSVSVPSPVASPPPTDHTLLIYPTSSDSSSASVRAEIRQTLRPAELGLQVSRVRTINNNGVAIDCSSKSDVETLRTSIAQHSVLKESVRCQEPGLRRPRLLIPNVGSDYSREEVEESLLRQNGLDSSDSVRVLFSFKGKRGNNWIVSCGPSVFRQLCERGRVTIGWERYQVFEHLHLPRCFRCYRVGHLQTACSSRQVCSLCGGPHAFIDCHPSVPCCVVCRDNNSRAGGSLPTDHCALDRDCPSYQRALSALRRRIDYG